MKIKRFVCLLLSALLVLGCSFVPVRAAEEDSSVMAGCHTLEAQVPLRSDSILNTAQASILYEINSDTVVYGTNMDLKFDPGSFVKLMTGLIAVEQGASGDIVTITQEMLDQVPDGSSVVGLVAGEQITMEDLIYCMMVGSANDAAVALAVYYGESTTTYLKWMNEKARELGCTDTVFKNVHGIEEDGQTITARDLVRLTLACMESDLLVDALSTGVYGLGAHDVRPENQTLFTNNYMISRYILEMYQEDRCKGGKVSYNTQGKRSLMIMAEQGSLSYIGVVVNTTPEYNPENEDEVTTFREFVEMSKMLDVGFTNYQVAQVFYPGQVWASIPVTNGENNVAVGPTSSVKTLLPADTGLNSVTVRYVRTNGNFTAPIENGAVLDVIQLWQGSVCLAQSDLVAMNPSAVAATTAGDVGTAAEAGTSDTVDTILRYLGIAVLVLAGLMLLLLIVRWVRTANYRNRRRRRRMDRRRSR